MGSRSAFSTIAAAMFCSGALFAALSEDVESLILQSSRADYDMVNQPYITEGIEELVPGNFDEFVELAEKHREDDRVVAEIARLIATSSADESLKEGFYRKLMSRDDILSMPITLSYVWRKWTHPDFIPVYLEMIKMDTPVGLRYSGIKALEKHANSPVVLEQLRREAKEWEAKRYVEMIRAAKPAIEIISARIGESGTINLGASEGEISVGVKSSETSEESGGNGAESENGGRFIYLAMLVVVGIGIVVLIIVYAKRKKSKG